jgi:hypothetical protein
MRARIDVSDYTPCDQLLADYVQISGDPAYKAESPGAREIYETKVASCYLEKRRPEKAMELSKGWTDEIFKNRVAARAHAELGQEAECRAALEALDRKSGAPPDFFTSWPSFDPTPRANGSSRSRSILGHACRAPESRRSWILWFAAGEADSCR